MTTRRAAPKTDTWTAHLPKYRLTATWHPTHHPFTWAGGDRHRLRRLARDLTRHGARVTVERRTTDGHYRPITLRTAPAETETA